MKFQAWMLGTIGVSGALHAEVGLLGGQTVDNNAYSTFVAVPNGNLTPISDLPVNASINTVSLNNSGNGVLGGVADSNGYATLISSQGMLIPLSITAIDGNIVSSAINTSGNVLIAGNVNSSGDYYAATVAPDGTVTPLTLSMASGYLLSAGLNDAGVGLVGGEGSAPLMYAAYISPTNEETVLTLPSSDPGVINSVAINSSGNGIVGGWYGSTPYGALTTEGESAVQLLTNLPDTGFGALNSVAINNAGLGLVGGEYSDTVVFAGYVATDGTITPLTLESFTTGSIQSVAINSSGKGLIGGDQDSNIYAAMVDPSGTVTPVIFSGPSGQINSVALDDKGIGLLGGQINGSEAYAALMAPNGTLTALDVSALLEINSVALANTIDNEIAAVVHPQSIGSGNSIFFTQLTAALSLEKRFISQNKMWKSSPTKLMASNSPDLSFMGQDEPIRHNSVWVQPFGEYIRLQGQGSFPNVTNGVLGGLLGYDWQEKDFIVGGALGYASNALRYGGHLGHGRIQEEMACLYGSYYLDHFWVDAVCWGGFYQFHNVRHGGSLTTSTSSTQGWILSPHITLATPWAMDAQNLTFVEPFVMFDWVANWQQAYTEKGASGFNLKMPSFFGSLLQSEGGLRFYERFTYGWGDFLLEEKISYINQLPFFNTKANATFVGSAVSFPIAVGGNQIENLAALGLLAEFKPANKAYPFGGCAFQVAAGSSYQSYFSNLFLGWNL